MGGGAKGRSEISSTFSVDKCGFPLWRR